MAFSNSNINIDNKLIVILHFEIVFRFERKIAHSHPSELLETANHANFDRVNFAFYTEFGRNAMRVTSLSLSLSNPSVCFPCKQMSVPPSHVNLQ